MNNRNAFAISSLIVLGMLLLSGWAWTVIPEGYSMPVHYGLDGTPDRYGGKFEGLLLIPLIAAVLTMLFAVIPRIDPRAHNLIRSKKAYSITWLAVTVLLLVLQAAMILQALGWQVDVVTIVSAGVGVLFTIIGNYLGKVRSNFFFGVRTPWTLSSEHSWNKTNRLGGRLLFGLGISCILAALTNASQIFLMLALGGSVGISLFLIIYSYLLWRDDSTRQNVER
ncbi:SdpI family protein [Pseudanabaena sp. FACHB-2040]|uniref:SdpI family protein n=1 Tax=Pseudanabaena sp. FACHB-2040 TaxID=2692859 RepID=UPI0016834748|nr:SdpI family protein [Pseudanabaena sp. FACHB-2040]MBD2256555.1 SdpI family protein [Pseudanabaena sp. FACHB-2040]